MLVMQFMFITNRRSKMDEEQKRSNIKNGQQSSRYEEEDEYGVGQVCEMNAFKGYFTGWWEDDFFCHKKYR